MESTLKRARDRALEVYDADSIEERAIVQAADAAIFEVIADLHSILYPEDWPRSRQPNHMYWDGIDGEEPEGPFEWPSGSDVAIWVGEAMTRIVNDLKRTTYFDGTV